MVCYLLEMLGRGLLMHLSSAFSPMLNDDNENCDISDLSQQVRDNPCDGEARLRLGGAQLRAGRSAAARQTFQALLAGEPDSLPGLVGMACALDDLGDSEAALECLQRALKLDANNPAIIFSIGLCHERLKNVEQAEAFYHRALHACPTLRNALERLAAMAVRAQHPAAAITYYERLRELDPDEIEVHLTLANLYLHEREYNKAIASYEQALTLDPSLWDVHDDLVETYEKAGLLREATEHLHEILEREPERVAVHVRLGDLYGRLGNDEAALDHLQRAVELRSDDLDANVRLAMQHLRAGRFLDAARWFNFATEINDRLMLGYVGLGVAQHLAGRDEEAASSFAMAASIEPNSTLLFTEMARMHLRGALAERADRKLSHLTTNGISEDAPCMAPADDNEETLGNLVNMQIARLRDALSASPNHADLHYRLGVLLQGCGEEAEAITCFRRALEINPCYVKALIKLGLALRDAGEADEAIEVLRRVSELRPEFVDVHYQLGLLFVQQQRFDIAVEQFEHAVYGNPVNLEFQANLALALQNAGLVDRANAAWRLICDLDPDSEHARAAEAMLLKQPSQV